jgi:hypothetical protein
MTRADVLKVVATCYRIVLGDEPWQDLGYQKRPKYGALIQLFRPRWKVAIEKNALREMLAMFTAAHILGNAASRNEVEEFANAYSVAGSDMGFKSRLEASGYFQGAIVKYLETPADAWPKLLFAGLNVNSAPEDVGARLLRGSCEVARNAQGMIACIR